MAANRYAQIWHGDHHHINIRFPSNEARLKFQNEFEAYHASHDHDGDIPTFKCVTTKDLKLSTGSRRPQDLVKAESDKDYRITIDGYSWNEIHDYHNPSNFSNYSWYRVPTCCVPPIIVIDQEFVDSGTLQRHELSAVFTDMPDDDFKKLCASIEANGFIEPVIRIYEGKILDGWHRYRAAKELNLIRKLKFKEWDEQDEGDPMTFVLARNIDRRHLTPGQRAQIGVDFNELFGKGNIKAQQESSGLPNGRPKTHQELAKQMGVGVRTIARAVEVKEAGRSEEVISGEKTAGEVITEETLKELWEQVIPAISAWKQRVGDVGYASKTMFVHAALRYMGLSAGDKTTPAVLKELLGMLTSGRDILEILIKKQLDGKSLWETDFEDDTDLIDAVKPRFQNAVETWRSSQVERLQKLEKLPVGRTPFIESEYIHTYFELAQPRISQNTKPTTAHYEGAIECMRDLPVAFAEQLEGRYYRKITAEWGKEVIPVLIKRFQGPLLGYMTSKLKADAYAVRIRQAIREQYAFQGRLTNQPFDVFFEITEDARTVLNNRDPKQWIRNGKQIPWALSVLPEPIAKYSDAMEELPPQTENISEETLSGLWKLVTAEMKAWKARDTEKCRYPSDSIGRASKTMLIKALRKYEESDYVGPATARELRDVLRLMKTDNFSFTLCVRETLKDEGTPESDREDSKCLKQKKQALKHIWDKRKQAAAYWVDSSTLNQALSLTDLEKGFVEAHSHHADAFRSAFGRTSETSFHSVVEKTLGSDVSLDVLKKEAGVMDTYAAHIQRWDRHEWIQQLIEKKKAKKAPSASESSPSERHVCWDQIVADMHDVYLEYENLPSDHQVLAMFLLCALDMLDEV